MTNYVLAREMWAGLDRAARLKMLEALKADASLAECDFAGLPPQVHAGIVAGMPVEAAAAKTHAAEPDDKTDDKTKKGKS